MTDGRCAEDDPHHAHIYVMPGQEEAAEALRSRFGADPDILLVGRLTKGRTGPHPIPQFEVHFRKALLGAVRRVIAASGLRALIHPLTDDDLADHTSLAEWIGEPVKLDVSALDPPGINQGVARFGKTDF
jgi:aromatic ring-cleaving dioxygenase